MTGILEVLTQNILPIFLVAGLGFWLRRSLKLDTKVLSSVVFTAFSPCLVFSSLVNTRLPAGELLQMSLFSLLAILAMGVVAFVTSRLLRLSRMSTVVLLMTVMFVNGGNYGLTLNQLRYGDEGLSRSIVYFVVSTVLVYTVGVFIASAGRSDWRESLRRLLRVPAVYAVAAALLVYFAGISVPSPLMKGVEVAAAGAVPAMLIVLGMQMANLENLSALRFSSLASFLRLVIGPLVALLVANLVGLQGLNRATSIIEASMPTAVITTVLATEFDVDPPLVTSIVVLSTLLSPITLAATIQLMGL
ncbi:MAG: AEC family transporter [Ardenticatenaceae bacterium]|nr:AEC family transporter [Anaerolineales bacterium]MCB8916430.1 AEC family transporter [Ardenticatenaceae bacterium]